MKCEKCHAEHEGAYATGRFCSSKCARGFSTYKDREGINSRVSAKLKGRPPSEKCIMNAAEQKHIYSMNYMLLILENDFDTLTKFAKRNRVIIEQQFKCNFCGNSDWFGMPITLELDHIDGDNKNNSRENLRALCPNCHSLTPTWRGKTNGGPSTKTIKINKFRAWLKDMDGKL